MQITLDSNNFNESYIGLRLDILEFVKGNNLQVLDLGCATGSNGKYLLTSGIANYIAGVELSKEMGDIAREVYNEVIIDTLDNPEVFEKLEYKIYDYILLGDILEHLNDPWGRLKQLQSLLAKNGKIIISLPNIQHIDTFIHLYIKGYWPYNERGIYDKTHLRFFTIKNIRHLVDMANLRIVTINRKFRYRDKLNSRFPFYGKLLIKIFPNLYTFQYLIICETK